LYAFEPSVVAAQPKMIARVVQSGDLVIKKIKGYFTNSETSGQIVWYLKYLNSNC